MAPDPHAVMRSPRVAASGTALSRFFIKIGFAQDEKGAQRAMLVIAIIALAVAMFFAWKAFGRDMQKHAVPPAIAYANT